jgi:site-specific DNA-methyltransferase (adenine-specific)
MPVSEVRNIDCMVGMKEYPDKYFDLAIVDPPYFSGPERREFYGSKVSSIGVNHLYKKSAVWNVPGPEYFNELIRVSKNYIVWGCNYYDFQFHTGRIVWDKVNDSSDYSDCELAATNLIDHVRIFRFMWNGMLQGSLADGKVMEGNKSKNEKRIHPTQKPVQLYRWQLKKFASDGWKILDTHLGSGSSRIAAYDMGFDFTGYEIDKDYFDAQEKRFRQHTSQVKLFTQKVA